MGSGTSGFMFHESSSGGVVPPYCALKFGILLLSLCFLSISLGFFRKSMSVDPFDCETGKAFGGSEACNGARFSEMAGWDHSE